MLFKISVCLGIILTCHLGKGLTRRTAGVAPRTAGVVRDWNDLNPNVKFTDVSPGGPLGADDDKGSLRPVLGWDSEYQDGNGPLLGADDGGGQSRGSEKVLGWNDVNDKLRFEDITTGEKLGFDNSGNAQGGHRAPVLGWDTDTDDIPTNVLGADSGGGTGSGNRGTVLGWNDVNNNVRFEEVNKGEQLGFDDSGNAQGGNRAPVLGWDTKPDNGPANILGADSGGGTGSGGRGTIFGWKDVNNNVRFEDVTNIEQLGFDGSGTAQGGVKVPVLGWDTEPDNGGGSPGSGNRGTVLGIDDINDDILFDLNGEGDGLVGPQPSTFGFDTSGKGDGVLGSSLDCDYINRQCQCQSSSGSSGNGGWGTGGSNGGGNPFPKPQLQMDDYDESKESDDSKLPTGPLHADDTPLEDMPLSYQDPFE